MGEEAREAVTAFMNSCGQAESTGPSLLILVSVPPALADSLCAAANTPSSGYCSPYFTGEESKM